MKICIEIFLVGSSFFQQKLIRLYLGLLHCWINCEFYYKTKNNLISKGTIIYSLCFLCLKFSLPALNPRLWGLWRLFSNSCMKNNSFWAIFHGFKANIFRKNLNQLPTKRTLLPINPWKLLTNHKQFSSLCPNALLLWFLIFIWLDFLKKGFSNFKKTKVKAAPEFYLNLSMDTTSYFSFLSPNSQSFSVFSEEASFIRVYSRICLDENHHIFVSFKNSIFNFARHFRSRFMGLIPLFPSHLLFKPPYWTNKSHVRIFLMINTT